MATDDKELEYSGGEEPRLYEVGYHLLPTVAEESLLEEALKIKDAIGKHSGLIVSDQAPRHVLLAYSIPKVISERRKHFDTAFFGWVRFRMSPSELLELKEELRHNKNILRFILIQAEDIVVPVKRMTFLKEKPMATSAETKKEKAGVVLSEEELDKTIEELVTD